MKRSIISAAVLSAVFMSAGAFAVDTDSGILNINGKVTGTSCQFVDGATEATITLSSIPDSLFNEVDVGNDVTYGEGVPVHHCKLNVQTLQMLRFSFLLMTLTITILLYLLLAWILE